MVMKKDDKTVVYQTKQGALQLKGDFEGNTIWASQADIVNLFEVDQSVVSRHIRNIFNDGEVDQKSNMHKMHIAHSDRPVTFYSLDIILAVGYRTNSATAIQFRQWATKTLRQYITEGYVVDAKRIEHNYDAFMEAVKKVQAVLPKAAAVDSTSVLALVQLFADTWFSLDAYDKEQLSPKRVSKRRIALTAAELMESVAVLKAELMKKGEATEHFAQPRTGQSVEGIVGNVMQSFGGKAVYPTVEAKAAHLLYFMVKNHPFADGNKRSGAYAFVWFLEKARVLNPDRLSPTALTLLVAESDPADKEKVVGLVEMLIAQR
jgi:hypothetical protein